MLRTLHIPNTEQFVSITTTDQNGERHVLIHEVDRFQTPPRLTTAVLSLEDDRVDDLVIFDGTIWLCGEDADGQGALWTIENPSTPELSLVTNAPYGYFKALASHDDTLMLLERTEGNNAWIHRIYRLSSDRETVELYSSPHISSTGADDLALFWDPYLEIVKPTIVGGTNGAEFASYESHLSRWVRVGSLGNTSRIEASPTGLTGFMVQWSGRRITPILPAAQPAETSASQAFSNRGIYGGAYSPQGTRAMVVGRTSVDQASIITWYSESADCHDPSDCPWVDQPLPNFTNAPYYATSNTYLMDVAYGDDGRWGLIVGGETSFNIQTGLFILFQLAE